MQNFVRTDNADNAPLDNQGLKTPTNSTMDGGILGGCSVSLIVEGGLSASLIVDTGSSQVLPDGCSVSRADGCSASLTAVCNPSHELVVGHVRPLSGVYHSNDDDDDTSPVVTFSRELDICFGLELDLTGLVNQLDAPAGGRENFSCPSYDSYSTTAPCADGTPLLNDSHLLAPHMPTLVNVDGDEPWICVGHCQGTRVPPLNHKDDVANANRFGLLRALSDENEHGMTLPSDSESESSFLPSFSWEDDDDEDAFLQSLPGRLNTTDFDYTLGTQYAVTSSFVKLIPVDVDTIESDNDEFVVRCCVGRVSFDDDSDDAPHRKQAAPRMDTRSPRSQPDVPRSSRVEFSRDEPSAKRNNHSKSYMRQYKRDRSEIPGGGWFRETTAGPEMARNDELSTNIDTGDFHRGTRTSNGGHDSSERRDDAAQRRRRRRMLQSIKIKTPSLWKGSPDLDAFDRWTYEVDSWCDWHDITDQESMRIVGQFLDGKASRFFMRHVATHRDGWTLKDLYEALFDECFPTNFKQELRERLMRMKQRDGGVRDFARDIENLAERFPDVSSRQLRQVFWDGIHSYLRIHLIEKGKSPEKDSLATLIKYASRHEEAIEAYEHEERRLERREERHRRRLSEWSDRDTSRVEGTSKNVRTDDGAEPRMDRDGDDGHRHHRGSLERWHGPRDDNDDDVADDESDDDDDDEKIDPGRDFPNAKERDQLKREGRCFKCRMKGHRFWECPVNQQDADDGGSKLAKGKGVEVNSVRFASENAVKATSYRDSKEDSSFSESENDEEYDSHGSCGNGKSYKEYGYYDDDDTHKRASGCDDSYEKYPDANSGYRDDPPRDGDDYYDDERAETHCYKTDSYSGEFKSDYDSEYHGRHSASARLSSRYR